MLNQHELLQEVASLEHVRRRRITTSAELSKSDDAFFITAGKALIREDAVFKSGLDSTQTFTAGDSIYLAAVASKRSRDWNFTVHEPLDVIAVEGAAVREAVMKSGFLVNEMIRNCVTRIFNVPQRENATFEDRFLRHFRKVALRSLYETGASIYRIGDAAKGLYFIDEGSVYLTTLRNAKFATLQETDFFGEASLISASNHTKNAYAETDSSLLLLTPEAVEAEVNRETALVKLVLSNILRVLELMNQLRFSHLNSTNFKGLY